MIPPPFDLTDAAAIAVAALAGRAVGVERELSGHASGPAQRFAGVRTFFMLGTAAGIAGWLAGHGFGAAGTALLLGGAILVAAAYVMAARGGGEAVDGTTEVAALAVLAIGTAAGLGLLALAGGAAAVIALALGEKERIERSVRRIDPRELRAGLQFAVLALVILPVLPAGPFSLGPLGSFRPRGLWTVVLLFSGLNFAGYVARRAIGRTAGYPIAGLLGGTISSTAVALGFSQRSRETPSLAAPLAVGVVGACTVLLPRVWMVSTILNPRMALALAPFLLPPLVVGLGMTGVGLGRRASSEPSAEDELRSPLGLWGAVKMALAFQAVLILIHVIEAQFGRPGVLTSAAVLGLTDVDALTLAMARLGAEAEMLRTAARAIAIGVLSNTVLKLGLTLVFGAPAFRRVAATQLGVLVVATGLGLWVGW